MEAFQMLKFSVLRGRPLNFTQGMGKDEEERELEAWLEDQAQAPEDVKGFILSLLSQEDD
jgi:hypothetical protein